MSLAIGHRVRHSARPDWGPGEILAISPDGKTTVYFAMVGQKTLKGAPLEPLTGPEASHPLLEHRIRTQSRGTKTREIAHLRAAFLRLFPGGFSDPYYLETERDYKIKASDLLASTLDPTTLDRLVAASEYAEIRKRALDIINATNLVFPNEKMALKGGLSLEGAAGAFARALAGLLYGTSSFESRFGSFADVLGQIGAAPTKHCSSSVGLCGRRSSPISNLETWSTFSPSSGASVHVCDHRSVEVGGRAIAADEARLGWSLASELSVRRTRGGTRGEQT